MSLLKGLFDILQGLLIGECQIKYIQFSESILKDKNKFNLPEHNFFSSKYLINEINFLDCAQCNIKKSRKLKIHLGGALILMQKCIECYLHH